jgi:transposase-like protein
MAFNKVFNEEEKSRLKKLVQEGDQVLYELDALNEGLRDTVKAIAEEMDLKPSILMKAIKVAHKAKFTDERDNFDELETILETVGKTL